MLPLATSASLMRPGRAPLRERETKTWAETTPSASAGPADTNADDTNAVVAVVDAREPAVDARAGAYRVRGGFVDDAVVSTSKPRTFVTSTRRTSTRSRDSRETATTTKINTKTKTTRPPFVVGAGDSARARSLSVSKPLKENRGGLFHTGDAQKMSHRHSSLAYMASGAPPSVSTNAPAVPSSFRAREEASPRAETDANADLFAAAVDATRSLFDAVEQRVRDAVEREMVTRHRRGVAEGVASPLGNATSLPAAAEKSEPSPASAASPATRSREPSTADSASTSKLPDASPRSPELAAPVDDVSEALESVSLLSGDRKTPIRAVKRSIDAYLERRRVGSSAGGTTTSSASSTPVVAARSVFAAAERRATVADPPERADRPEPPDPPEPPERRAAVSTRVGVAMTAKQRALQPPTLATRDDADASGSEPFAYAPVYSPVAAREATESLHSPFRKTPFDAADETADAFGNSFSSKRRFSRGVEPVGVDLRARLRAAGRYGNSVSPRERDGERTSPTRDSDSDSTSVSDDRDTAVAFPKGGRLNVPETSSSSSEYDESNDGDGNTNVSEMVSFCRRYRAARVRASVLERWMYQARLRVALAVAHHEHSSRARAFYAWRAERLERAIRVEVALRFAKHARKTHARRLLAKTARAWLRETRRSKAFRVHEMASTTSSKSNEDGLAAARSRLRPVHGLAVEDAASKETQHPRIVGDSTAAVAETGTMTDDVDVVEKNALETVPVSLDAFLRVLVDGLVDEAVRAHEAAEACGPLVSSTPTALATDEGEGVSEVASEADRDDRGEDREEDARENVDRRVEDESARLESRGFSPEHAAAVDAVTADAADAVGVAVRGLLGLWKLSDDARVGAEEDSASPRPSARRRNVAKSPLAADLATPRRTLRFDPLRSRGAFDANVDDDKYASPISQVGECSRTTRDAPRVSSASRPRRSRRVVFNRARGTTMLSAGTVGGADGEEVYLSIAEYVDVVNKAAASYV